MRNLEELFQRRISNLSINDKYPVILSSVHEGVFIMGNGCALTVYKIAGEKFEILRENKLEGISESDFIISAALISSLISACIITKEGLIILWENFPLGEFVIKSENTAGYSNVSWSEKPRFVAIYSKNDTQPDNHNGYVYIWDEISQFTDYNVVIDLSNPEMSTELQRRSLDWGNEATQFVGRGKKPKQKELPEPIIPTDGDEGKTILSWVSDGEFLAINYYDKISSQRKVGTWSPKGLQLSVMEHVGPLLHFIDWVPSSGLISCVIKTETDYTLVLYETPGYKRLTFSLYRIPLSSKIVHINWSKKFDVFGVHTFDGVESNIYMYIQSNTHFFLKGCYSSKNYPIVTFAFLFDISLLIVSTTQLINYNMCLKYNATQNDVEMFSTVAMIDGDFVGFTAFGQQNNPPPASTWALQLPFVPSCVLVASHISDKYSDALALNRPNDNIALIKMDISVRTFVQPRISHGCLLKIAQINVQFNIDSFKSPRFLTFNSFIVFAFDITSNVDRLFIISFDYEQGVAAVLSTTLLKHSLLCVSDAIFDNTILVQYLNRQLVEISLSDLCCVDSDIVTDQIIRSMSVVRNSNKLVFYNTENNFIYVNDIKLHMSCNAIILTPVFLLMMIGIQQVICLPIQYILDHELVKHFSINYRTTEYDARFVTAVPFSCDLVLETTRVEVEILNPIHMVFFWFNYYVDLGDYKNAILLLQRHLVDTNVVFDHNPSAIINDIDSFVRQVEEPALLLDLIETINNVDSITTTYTNAYLPGRQSLWTVNKVIIVSSRIAQACLCIDEEKYKFVIILCLLKEFNNIPVNALKYISGFTSTSRITKESAIKFVKHHIPSDELYKSVLGSYDLSLARVVGKVIGRDPSEYIPYMNNLEKTSIPYRYFLIDKDLNNYLKALQSIILCDDKQEECLEFIKIHKLHKQALELVEPTSLFRKCISLQLAGILAERRHHSAAGILYYTNLQYYDAFHNFCKAGSYCEAMICIDRLPQLDIHIRNNDLKRLSVKLTDRSHYLEAAEIHRLYIKDEQEILILTKGAQWKKAYYYVMVDKTKYMSLNFNDLLVKRSENIKSMQANSINWITAKIERLLELRNPLYHMASRASLDSASETLSVSSGDYTISTSPSTTRKKKENKYLYSKFYKIVTGSEHEDFAIMHELYTAYTNIIKEDSEIKEIIALLMMLDMLTLAQQLCDSTNYLKTFLKNNYKVIWNPNIHIGPVKMCEQPQAVLNNSGAEEMPIVAIPENHFDKIELHLPKIL